jgi:hypothetical protein
VKIDEIIDYGNRIRPVIKFEQETLLFCQKLGINLPPVPSGEMIGMEVEVEGIYVAPGLLEIPLWRADHDGSLKDAGMELKSIPIRSEYSMYALTALQEALKRSNPGYYCGERAAFHLHLNVRDLTTHQLAMLCLLYSTVEKVFFNLTHEYRAASNFCVPVNHTETFYFAVKSLLDEDKPDFEFMEAFVEDFGGKYAAFGVFRLIDLGTVEFRHMHSNFDLPLLAKWLTIAINLKQSAKRLSPVIIQKLLRNINTTSYYEEYVKSILGLDGLLPEMEREKFFRSIRESITNAKQIFVRDIEEVPLLKLIDSPLGKKIVERMKL